MKKIKTNTYIRSLQPKKTKSYRILPIDKGKQIVNRSKLEWNYLKRIFSRKKEDDDVKIESLKDLDEQIERFGQNKLDLINPNIIYKKENLLSKSLLYINYSERYVIYTWKWNDKSRLNK